MYFIWFLHLGSHHTSFLHVLYPSSNVLHLTPPSRITPSFICLFLESTFVLPSSSILHRRIILRRIFFVWLLCPSSTSCHTIFLRWSLCCGFTIVECLVSPIVHQFLCWFLCDSSATQCKCCCLIKLLPWFMFPFVMMSFCLLVLFLGLCLFHLFSHILFRVC